NVRAATACARSASAGQPGGTSLATTAATYCSRSTEFTATRAPRSLNTSSRPGSSRPSRRSGPANCADATGLPSSVSPAPPAASACVRPPASTRAVLQADHADGLLLRVADEDALHLVLLHQVARAVHIVLGRAAHDFVAPEVAQLRRFRVESLRDDADGDVAIGHRADRAAGIIHDGNDADVPLRHHPRDLLDGGVHLHGGGALRHDLLAAHRSLLGS